MFLWCFRNNSLGEKDRRFSLGLSEVQSVLSKKSSDTDNKFQQYHRWSIRAKGDLTHLMWFFIKHCQEAEQNRGRAEDRLHQNLCSYVTSCY